ncbi:MAG: hypothetical protein ACI9FR_002518 [Cryomorphaceae bacterium]
MDLCPACGNGKQWSTTLTNPESQLPVTAGAKIPRDKQDNYSQQAIQQLQEFIKQQTGVDLQHVAQSSHDL